MQKEQERECELPGRVDWPLDGSTVLPQTAGQPGMMFRAHICGLEGLRSDNVHRINVKLDGFLYAVSDHLRSLWVPLCWR